MRNPAAAKKHIAMHQDLICPKWRDQVEIVNKIQDKSGRSAENQIIVTDNPDRLHILESIVNLRARHICQSDVLSFENELNTSALMICNPERFMQDPLTAIMNPRSQKAILKKDKAGYPPKPFQRKFSKANERKVVLGELENFLFSSNLLPSLVLDILTVADELFTNAIYHAPYKTIISHQDKKAIRTSSTDEDVELPNGYKAQITLGLDRERIGICCIDPFGRLNEKDFIKRIHNCEENGPGSQISYSTRGAGIGSYIVFNLCSSLYLGVHDGKRTVVGATFANRTGLRNIRNTSDFPKNIHLLRLGRTT